MAEILSLREDLKASRATVTDSDDLESIRSEIADYRLFEFIAMLFLRNQTAIQFVLVRLHFVTQRNNLTENESLRDEIAEIKDNLFADYERIKEDISYIRNQIELNVDETDTDETVPYSIRRL